MLRIVASRSFALGLALSVFGAGACGDDGNNNPGTGGKSGAGGSAGRGGTTGGGGRGGTTGAGGVGGAAGMTGVGGAGGGAGRGGVGGTAGNAGGAGGGGGIAGSGGAAGAAGAAGGSGGAAGSGGSAGAAGTGGAAGAAGAGGAGGAAGTAGPVTFTVLAAQHRIILDSCSVTPATLADVPAGTHTLALTASTLSKGLVNGTTNATQDPYVIVQLPLPAGDPQEHLRFFTLNGLNTSQQFTLPAMGPVRMMFIDSDGDYNTGMGTVTLNPGARTATVDAVNNLIRWTQTCQATPATATVSNRAHKVTLTAVSFSSGAGAADSYVLVRLPIEQPASDFRFVILNGVGDSVDFVPFETNTVRAWFIGQTTGATGSATLTVTDL
jgi:hypothetical protein